ncbi:hypothetical protein [Actinomadura sp. 9N215]|uniref:hypothetical protein n=1 Tax=Actinomadura sp. 9N215 TaxID=3375150 RepID=UPI00379CF2F2
MAFTASKAARLIGRATRRRGDGSRGPRARRSWRRLVLACGEGDPAVQDAVRDVAGELPAADVLDLLAAAPEQPADQAAYLTLIGQDTQRQALDPDGSLLALAYRAASPERRERLRTVMATAGDTDVIRVVVTGDQRDRITEMTYEELGYLGHQFAQHRQWDELRRLTRDLPIAKAVAAARLLPDHERPEPLADVSEDLRATIDRLPRDHLITHEFPIGTRWCASFSPDASELALKYLVYRTGRPEQLRVETLQVVTGEVAHHFSKGVWRHYQAGSILHLGHEILITHPEWGGIFRVAPEFVTLGPRAAYSDLRRSSGGAVAVGEGRLAFVDPGAYTVRYQPLYGYTKKPGRTIHFHENGAAVATLPPARLIALYDDGQLSVMDEDGLVIHETSPPWHDDEHGWEPALSFLSADSVALHRYTHPDTKPANTGHITEIWSLPPDGEPRRTDRHEGPIRKRWPLEHWQGMPLDDAFAARVATSGWHDLDTDLPWFQDPVTKAAGSLTPKRQRLLAVASGGDMYATLGTHSNVEVHCPHLPAAREFLERPLLRSSPKDLARALQLRAKIGDRDVTTALDLLVAALSERFGGEIALGPGPMAAGGTTDIALAQDLTELEGDA